MLNSTFWNRYFVVYDNLNKLIPYNDLLDTVVHKLDIKKGELILDAGSGTGNLSLLLHKNNARVVGLDISEEGIALHKTKYEDPKVLLHDLKKSLPFPDCHFEKICSNNTLYTIAREDRQGVINELYRVLKPGGVIVLSNIKKEFSPVKIYLDHINKSIIKNGLFKTIINIFILIVPTIKIFYYNYLIKKENHTGSYDFMENGEQKKLLEQSGFGYVEDDIVIYSQQGILNKALK